MSPRRIRSAGSDVNQYLAELRREGFEIIPSGGHWRILRDGKFVTRCSASPSDTNALQAIKRAVRRGMARLEAQAPAREKS